MSESNLGSFLSGLNIAGRHCSTERAAETPKVGISRVLVKASPAFGRRRLVKTRTILFLPRVVLDIREGQVS